MTMIFVPTSGQIICKPYIDENQTFKSVKEEAGYAQKSEVVAIGSSYVDDHGNIREPMCKKGDIILHKYAQDDYELDFEKYRVIHFSMLLGVAK